MTDPYAHRRFRRIETRAVLPDGRVRTSSYSYPLGVGKDVYDHIDAGLVRAFGNENCRTTGVFFENEGGCVKSDRTRREGSMPTPCIACGKALDSAANDPAFDDVPYAGTKFRSGGHYGSTVFDSFDGFSLDIVVCDECLVRHAGERVTLVRPDGSKEPWDGVTSDFDPDSPEGRARMEAAFRLFTDPDRGIDPAFAERMNAMPSYEEFVAGLPDGLPESGESR